MFLRLSFIALIIWCIYLIPSQFLHLDFFKIKKINIGESSEILNQELTGFAEKIYNKSIWEIDIKALKEKLSQDVRLESVDLIQEYAGELNVEVKEKELLYYAQIGKQIYLMDKSGKVFGYFAERETQSLPLVFVKEGEGTRELVEILKILKDYAFYDMISQIYRLNEHSIEIILVDGTKIITNETVDKQKYKVAMALYFELVRKEKIEYIDIRFQDFIIRYVEDDNEKEYN